MKELKHKSDEELFNDSILPLINESYPLSKINYYKRKQDALRVNFLRMHFRPASAICLTFLILKNEIIQVSEN
ncbi:MAG TPA: hypothetical protein VFQ58_04270 [Flavisolibacter sp.]|nr:hypothetical protein [Flavisolibacter sp.]